MSFTCTIVCARLLRLFGGPVPSLSERSRHHATELHEKHALHIPHRDVLVVAHRIRAGLVAALQDEGSTRRLPQRGAPASNAGMKASVVAKASRKRLNSPTMTISLSATQGGVGVCERAPSFFVSSEGHVGRQMCILDGCGIFPPFWPPPKNG